MNASGSDRHADRALVAGFLDSRSEAAFQALYRRYTPVLYGVVLRVLGGDTAETEEVLQDTWICVAEKLAGFRWESSLGTWLTAIALNFARNRYRGRRRRNEQDLAMVTELPGPPPIERVVDAIDMQRAVTSLAEGYREVVILHDVYGYTHDEIAEILGIAPGTSKSQLARARCALRRLLTETGDEKNERRTSRPTE